MQKFFCGVFLMVAYAVLSQSTLAQSKFVDLNGKGIPSVEVTIRYICPGLPGGAPITIEERRYTDEDGRVNLRVDPICPPPPSFLISFGKLGYRFSTISPFVAILGNPSPVPDEIIGTDLPALVGVSAASYQVLSIAGEMIIAAFGQNLATSVEQASGTPLPTVLAGRQVLFKDYTGLEKNAALVFVSPSQINCVTPAGLAEGRLIIKLTDGTVPIAAQFAYLTLVNPGIFSANADGKGVVAGIVVRVKSDGSQVYEGAAQYDAVEGKSVSLPIDLGAETDRVFLGIFGTGFRFVRQVSDIKVRIGGIEAAVTYAGPQFIFSGLDQINVEVPRSLIGAGEVDIVVTVAGNPANIVRAAFK